MSQINLPNMAAGQFVAFAFEQLSVADTAVALTTATLSDSDGHAKRAVISIESAQTRYRLDGRDPTSGQGHVANVGDLIILATASNIKNFRIIRTGSNSAEIMCSYEH